MKAICLITSNNNVLIEHSGVSTNYVELNMNNANNIYLLLLSLHAL